MIARIVVIIEVSHWWSEFIAGGLNEPINQWTRFTWPLTEFVSSGWDNSCVVWELLSYWHLITFNSCR